MQPAIRTVNVSKTYYRRQRASGFWSGLAAYFSTKREAVRAIDDISLSVQRGESVGLIGENGAGKSTTVKMLTGILSPTSGSVETLGLSPTRERRKLAMNIGVVFGQKPQLLWDIPTGESFKLMKAMYRIPDSVYSFTYHEALERLDLGELLTTPVRLLSLGQRMRCDLAAALLHAPAIAFLDEPTIGLDVLVKERVRGFLRDMQKKFGTTILLTTHDLKDITSICERLIVLDKGKVVYDGDLAGFEASFEQSRTLSARLEASVSVAQQGLLSDQLTAIGARAEWLSAEHLQVRCAPATAAKVSSLVLGHLAVRDFALQAVELESLVTQLHTREAQQPWQKQT